MSQPRSWLFVPADSEKKIAKAIASEADAIIFDLEDSVAPDRKQAARDLLKTLKREGGPRWWVRINPLDSGLADDLDWLDPGSAAVALYEISAALPPGKPRRELGRRVFGRLYEGTAATFATEII